jgi:hypothetical protein
MRGPRAGLVITRGPDDGDTGDGVAGEELDSRGLPLWMSQPSKPTYGLLEGDDEGSDDDEAPQGPSSSAGGASPMVHGTRCLAGGSARTSTAARADTWRVGVPERQILAMTGSGCALTALCWF